MDRRSFLTKTALGGSAAAAASLAAPAYAQGNRTLTMVTTWPRGFAGVHDAAQHVADNITAMSDGALTVDLKAAGELVGAFEVFDAVTAGQADMYHGADYYFINKHPAYGFFSSVPFGMTSQELANWYYHDGGQEFHDELGQIFGLKSFLAGNTGTQPGGWFNKEIRSVEDLQGLKFRMPGQGGEALGKLGVSVQNLPGGEIYQALSSGAIDGTDWVGPWADQSAGFQEITKIYYPAGFQEPGPGLSVAVNRNVFEELTPAQQKIIEVASAEAHQWNLAQFLVKNAEALGQLQASGVQLYSFPDDVWEAFAQASREVLEANTSDELFKRVYDSYLDSMRASSSWIQRSEGTYRAQRDRIMG
jgi:TRAP-type mannitol/chloroaromatic compound transport system substrate-binding protein